YFLYCSGPDRALHSFPTRRSSDLGSLGEALGQIYVRKTFPPEAEVRTLDMVRRIEDAMAKRIRDLEWMSPETKQQALEKLAGIRSEEHTSELQSRFDLVCRLLLEK